jgi:hypothetical protein
MHLGYGGGFWWGLGGGRPKIKTLGLADQRQSS